MSVKIAPIYNIVQSVVAPYIKFPKIWTDNYVFRLHCKVTVLMLFLACTLVSIGTYFGDPIDCVVEGVPDPVMDTYCWLHSTFTLPRLDNTLVHEHNGVVMHEPHPGIGPVYDEEPTEHRYYQWVGFTLMLQGLCFLVPYTLWKRLEGGRVDKLIPDCLVHEVTDKRMPGFAKDAQLVAAKDREEAVEKMRRHFTQTQFRVNRHLLIKFAICEFLNFLNVIVQMFFLNVFFDGAFMTYGSNVMSISFEDPEERRDPLNDVFPKVAKCDFSKYGPTGTIQKFDGLCILPLNIFNEKIFVVMWFWFVFLAIVSGLSLVWRLATILSGSLREWVLRSQTTLAAMPGEVATVTQRLTLGDWFILMQIGENIDSAVYLDLITALAKEFSREVRNGSLHTVKVSTC